VARPADLPRPVVEILESMSDAFVALDRSWHYTYVNRHAAAMLGRTPEQLIGKHIWTEFPEGVGQPFHLAYERAMRDQEAITLEEYYPPYDRWFENRIHPSPDGLMIFFQDVTDRHQREQELRRSEARYRVLAHAVATVVWRTDPAGAPIAAVQWPLLTGRPVGDGGDPDWREAVHPEDVARVDERWAHSLATGELFEATYRVRGADAAWRHVRVRGVPVREDDAIREWIGVMFDVTEQVDAEQLLRRAALEDPLTGLPNRAATLAHLDGVLARRDARAAVLYADIDRFKAINDTLGHTGGDAALRDVAEAIRGAVRPADLVGRLAGDEFVIVCADLHDEVEALAIARRVLDAVSRVPVGRISATISIGLALRGPAGAHAAPTDAEALLRDADAAMYEAKARGGRRVEVFDTALRRRLRRRRTIESELRRGREGWRGLELHYQPIVWFDERRRTACEALLRWRTPGGPELPAAEAISVAEETGLIADLGTEVMRRACLQAAVWERDVDVSVNVSAKQLTRPDELVAAVSTGMEDAGLQAGRLHLEITENVLMHDMDRGERLLRALRELGVGVKIDDFGVGYSSLSYLHRLPATTVKIDRSFVTRLDGDPAALRIIDSVVGLARALGVAVVAEGVETAEQLAAVRAAGCDGVQGYFLARPAPPSEAPAAIEAARAAAGPRP
jgi:diguanylate cyclase (GGDEF)-like protein/PAS domain S-box-containing protein